MKGSEEMAGYNIGIDLGTSTVTAFVSGRGIVLSEDNAICYDAHNDAFVALGDDAGRMFGKAPESYILKRPISDGVISDFTVMADILSRFLTKICKNSIFRHNVLISAPSCSTQLEKKTVIEAACAAGAGKVHLVDEPVVSALGAGLSIDHPKGVMVIDLGGGTTDIAVITMGTVAYATSLRRVSGDTMDEAICQYVKKNTDIHIGKQTGRKIKHAVGCAVKREEEIVITFTGKDIVTGMPKNFSISSHDVCDALKENVESIFDGVMDVLEQTPPELYSDICNEGIVLTGGVAKLYGLDKFLADKLGIKVTVAHDPEHCGAKGAGFMLKNIKKLEDNGYSFRLREQIF